MTTQREQALAAVAWMEELIALLRREEYDITAEGAAGQVERIRAALTPLSDPGLQTMVDRADDVREAGFPVLADDVDNVLFELMEHRARPTLTAEEARRAGTWAQFYAADDANEWTTAHADTFAAIRAIAEGSAGE